MNNGDRRDAVSGPSHSQPLNAERDTIDSDDHHNSNGINNSSDDTSKSNILVITYRDHHHAYPDDTQTMSSSSSSSPSASSSSSSPSTTTIVTHTSNNNIITTQHIHLSNINSRYYNYIELIYSFLLVHYLFYAVPVIMIMYILYLYNYWYIDILLILLYIPSYIDNAEMSFGRQWEWFRQNSIWHYSHRYAQLEVIRQTSLNNNKRYIFAVHPHGILILSRIGVYGGLFEKIFPNLTFRTLAASPMFYVPLAREICLWMGAIDANKKTALRVLTDPKPQSLVIYPGGSKEIFATDPQSNITLCVGRKGFIRLALETGADIVPVMVFGEKWSYNTWLPPTWLRQLLLTTLRLPVIVFWGRFCTWMPLKGFLSIVYGKPISTQNTFSPLTDDNNNTNNANTNNANNNDDDDVMRKKLHLVDQRDVDRLYEEYVLRMTELFEQYKIAYGYPADSIIKFVEETKNLSPLSPR